MIRRRRRDALPSLPGDIDLVLLEWAPGVPWTMRDSFAGCQVFGSTGSGKTSGSLSLLCHNFLAAGYGGVFFTVKSDDRATYERYIRECGREDDLLILGPDSDLRMNFIACEMAQCRDAVGLAENLTALIMTVAELGDRSRGPQAGGSENAEYFRNAMMRLCRHAMLVLVLSDAEITVPNLHRLVVSAPRARKDVRDETWQARSFFFRCLQSADKAPMTASQKADFELALLFFLEEWAELSPRTRSTVESTLTATTDALSRGAVRDCLSAPEPNFTPSMLYDGKILIVDFPVLMHREIGQLIQVIVKYTLQRAHSRRDVSANPRPTFMICDEYQHLCVDADHVFQTTARSSHTAVVYATQSISTFLDALGAQAEPKVHSLLGNLQTQVFHQQTDTQTIKYIQELIGRSRQFLMNGNTTHATDVLGSLLGEPGGGSAGFSEHLDFALQAKDLNGLAKGGPPHWFTEAIVYMGGKPLARRKTWQKVRISQRR